VVDPGKRFIFTVEKSYSKSSNTPFDGWELQGKAVMSMVGGRITHKDF
jgi:dihydroorotase